MRRATNESSLRTWHAVVPAAVLVALAAAFAGAELALRRGVVESEAHLRWASRDDGSGDGPLLLVLGDSFFTRRAEGGDIEDRLREHLRGTGVRIVNPSFPGYGPYQYLGTLLRALRRARPDVILLSHYVGNDLMDVGCGADARERLREVVAEAPPSIVASSFVVQHLGAIVHDYLMRHPGFDWPALARAGIPEEDLAKARRFEVNPYVIELGARHPRYYRETLLLESECALHAWASTERTLDEILRRASAAQARVVPVIFPQTLQVSRLHHDLYRRWRIEVSDEFLVERRPQDRLLAFYRARGIEALDLLPAFRAATAQLYWDQDEHLNPAGDELAADEIARFLVARGLLLQRPGS